MKARFGELLERCQQGLAAAEALKNTQLIAGCQNNLGGAYLNLPTGDRRANLEKAIACYQAAIRGYEAAGVIQEADRLRQLVESLKSD